MPDADSMRWVSVLSEAPDPLGAAGEVARRARDELGGSPDLALLFCSEAYLPDAERLSDRVRAELGGGLLAGCSAHSVIGDGREVEERPALSLTAARLPRVAVHGIRLAGEGLPRGARRWCEAFELAPDVAPQFVLLGDPFTCDAQALVAQIDVDFPGSVQVGGLASGSEQPGGHALFLDGRVHRHGLVGVALQGDVAIDSVVAQGCRPIGLPMFVTRVRDGLLVELDGRPPMDALRALFDAASLRDRALMQTALFLGVEMHADRASYGRGDFLVRNLLGGDPDSGALVVAAALREGQVVQFQLRDATTSAEDLAERLDRYARTHGPGAAPRGALLFSCLGRGAGLYGRPDHDSELLRSRLGPIPLGGFFCNGEIGPVERRTFLHGYTSSFGLFRPADPA